MRTRLQRAQTHKLKPADTSKPSVVSIPPVTDTAVFYTSDCRGEGGGGMDEKFLRFRRFKEVARDLNEEVDAITHDEAMARLVEQVWNAPFSTIGTKRLERMRTAKAFNIPTSNFPANAAMVAANRVEEELLEFKRPSAQELAAVAFPVGSSLAAGAASSATNIAENAIGFADSGDVIYFRHMQPDGVLMDHYVRREGVGQAALVSAIVEGLKSFSVDPNFGKCPWHGSDCGALLFPDEIKPFVPPELFEKYFVAFNRMYAQRKKIGVAGYTLEGVPVPVAPPPPPPVAPPPVALGGAGTGNAPPPAAGAAAGVNPNAPQTRENFARILAAAAQGPRRMGGGGGRASRRATHKKHRNH